LTQLTAAVRGARSGEGKLNPIRLAGKDELSELAHTINAGFVEVESMREELEQRHQDLTRSEEHFRALIENSSDLIAVMDNMGTIQFQSPSSMRTLGYRPAELEGQSAFDFVHPADVASSQRAFAQLMRAEWDPSRALETRFRHKDGSWRTLEMMGKRLDGPSGELLCVLNSRDVTERIAAESALRVSEEQLHQSQKMEAVGQLAGGIAHDFNNLLTAILGYSDLLLARKELADSSAHEDIEEIKAAAERASALTRQILAFSRRQALRPAVVSLNDSLAGWSLCFVAPWGRISMSSVSRAPTWARSKRTSISSSRCS
jgi:PAS domain S-box-containing protein